MTAQRVGVANTSIYTEVEWHHHLPASYHTYEELPIINSK